MIAFLGVGRMGAPMAANLARAGNQVRYFDPFASREAALLLSEAGAERATRVELLANSSESFSMLPDAQTTKDALFGEGGLLHFVTIGHVHVAMGTIGSTAARELATECAERGIDFADAPVSGSTATAALRNLATFVGASGPVFERIRPFLAAMSKSQTHTGLAGTGSAMKLAVNLIVAQVNQAMAEGLIFAERNGIAREIAYDAIEDSVIATQYASYKRPVFLDPVHAPVAAPISVLAKDLSLTADEAKSLRLVLPGSNAARSVIDQAVANGLATADIGAVIRMVGPQALGRTTRQRKST